MIAAAIARVASAEPLRRYGEGWLKGRLGAEPIPRARAVRIGDRLRWFIAVESLRATVREKLARKLDPCARWLGCGRMFCLKCDNGPYS